MQRIHYKPAGIKDLLVRLRALTSLMADLAYSSVLFNDPDIAEEVLAIEEEIDRLRNILRMNAMLAAHDAEDAEQLLGVLEVADATDRISDALADIAALTIRKRIHPIFVQALSESEDRLVKVEVAEGAPLVGTSLREVYDAIGAAIDIIAVRRGKRWVLSPSTDFRFRPGDIIVAWGSEAGITLFRDMAGGESVEQALPAPDTEASEQLRQLRRVVLDLKDLSEIAVDLAYSAVLYNSKDIAEEVLKLEAQLDDLSMMFADRVLEICPRDQPRAIAGLLQIGVAAESIGDAARSIANVVLELEPHPVLKLAIEESPDTVYRVTVKPGSAMDGKEIRELNLLDLAEATVSAIRRERRWFRNPSEDFRLQAGDVLIVSGTREGEKIIRRLASRPAKEVRKRASQPG
ncbi:hypothetical protein DRN94_002115 [archaeon]|nr:hypothetical protein [archaeon]